MRIIRALFILSASLIVLAHNLIPHDHCVEKEHNDHDSEVHQVVNEWIDPFLLVLHEDGQGNLEQIRISENELQSQDFQWLPVLFVLWNFECLPETTGDASIHFLGNNFSFLASFLADAFSHRGPPLA
jgi:hypothetical protein